MRIYHEKQSAACCGRHALNNLLGGAYYDDVALADIARELDRRELALLAANGADASALMRAGSNNVDDSGNFSLCGPPRAWPRAARRAGREARARVCARTRVLTLCKLLDALDA